MSLLVRAGIFVLALIVSSCVDQSSRDRIQSPNDAPNPYETVANRFKLPEGREWGATSAVDIDADGRSIWVAERCGANSCAGSPLPSVLKFNPSGQLVKSFGAGMLIFPHGIHVDRDGNVWITDARAATREELEKTPEAKGKGHQVIKFSPNGDVLLKLGTAGVAGDPPDFLYEPSDVTTAANGDIFVADGHGGLPDSANKVARIVKFSSQGKFIKAWGTLGSAPGQLNAPHSIVLDSQGRLFVADRNNNRIQIFDQEGTFIDQWTNFSRPSGLYIDKNDKLYVADSESGSVAHERSAWKRGIRLGSVKDGVVTAFIPDPDEKAIETSAAEGVAVDREGNIFGAEVGPRGVKLYVLKH